MNIKVSERNHVCDPKASRQANLLNGNWFGNAWIDGNELPNRLMSFHPEMEVLYMAGYTENADAHLKRQLIGREVVVAITEGKLDFGPWEQIFYAEFDGKRNKRVLVKVIGE